MGKKRNSKRIALISVAVVLLLAVGACALYLGDYYKADYEAIGSYLPDGSAWKTDVNGDIVFEPAGATKGFIFYPGGKVENEAYIPLMHALAEQGVLCVIAEMPFRLAVLDVNAAEDIREDYPQIEQWYIGGHSLGGAMAAAYLADHPHDFRGLALLGAYSTADLTDTDTAVQLIFGSEDGVMNHESYRDCKENLPATFRETVIPGGCHAYFGMYGPQEGDGTPTITNEAQIEETARLILEMMGEGQ
jgi:dienelactone hydrolase